FRAVLLVAAEGGAAGGMGVPAERGGGQPEGAGGAIRRAGTGVPRRRRPASSMVGRVPGGSRPLRVLGGAGGSAARPAPPLAPTGRLAGRATGALIRG